MSEYESIEPQPILKEDNSKDQPMPSLIVQDTATSTEPEQKSFDTLINDDKLKANHTFIIPPADFNQKPEEDDTFSARPNTAYFLSIEEQVNERKSTPATPLTEQNPNNTANDGNVDVDTDDYAEKEEEELKYHPTFQSEESMKTNCAGSENLKTIIPSNDREEINTPLLDDNKKIADNTVLSSWYSLPQSNLNPLLSLGRTEDFNVALQKIGDIRPHKQSRTLSSCYAPRRNLLFILVHKKIFTYRYSHNKFVALKSCACSEDAKLIKCLRMGDFERLFVAGEKGYFVELKIQTLQAKCLLSPSKNITVNEILSSNENPNLIAVISQNQPKIDIYDTSFGIWDLVKSLKGKLLSATPKEVVYFQKDFIILTAKIPRSNPEIKEFIKINFKDDRSTQYPFKICGKSDVTITKYKDDTFLLCLALDPNNQDVTEGFELFQFRLDEGDRISQMHVLSSNQTFQSMKSLPVKGYSLLTSEVQEIRMLSVCEGVVMLGNNMPQSSWISNGDSKSVRLNDHLFTGINQRNGVSVFKLNKR